MSERSTVTDVLLIILSIFLPFVAVGIRRGFCTADFLINFALCFLGYIPGLIHAWYIIAKYPRAERTTENEPLLYA